MSKSITEFEILSEYNFWGEEGSSIRVKPGDQIRYTKQKILHPETKKGQKRIIAKYGKGPFNLLEIRRYPTKVLFLLVDEDNKETEMAPIYLTKI